MADLGHFAQFARTLLCGHLWSRRFRPKVARSLHFKRILMSREDHLRRAVFQAPKLGLLLSHFPLVPPIAEFQKMADLGHFSQFAETLLCGHFWSRRVPQKVARSLRFKRILMSREDHLHRAVFQAPKLGLLLSHFPLVPPLKNFRKWPI